MNAQFRWFVFALAVALTGCATREYRRVEAECLPLAQHDYPPEFVQSNVTRQRIVPIFMGRNCITTPSGSTVCQDLVQQQSVPYEESMVVDRNEEIRHSAVRACAKNLCMQRYGNVECK